MIKIDISLVIFPCIEAFGASPFSKKRTDKDVKAKFAVTNYLVENGWKPFDISKKLFCDHSTIPHRLLRHKDLMAIDREYSSNYEEMVKLVEKKKISRG